MRRAEDNDRCAHRQWKRLGAGNAPDYPTLFVAHVEDGHRHAADRATRTELAGHLHHPDGPSRNSARHRQRSPRLHQHASRDL